jgi:hypothetical protein
VAAAVVVLGHLELEPEALVAIEHQPGQLVVEDLLKRH